MSGRSSAFSVRILNPEDKMKTCTLGVAVAATLAASLATSWPAAGQFPGQPARSRMVRVGFAGGVAVPVDDAGSALKNGINGQAFVLVSTGSLPPLRFNLGYQKYDFDESAVGGVSGTSTIVSGVAGLSVDLFQLGPIRPYVTAGLGAFNVAQELNGVSAGDESDLRFGVDGGAGLALRIGHIDGFVEAKLQNVYTDAGVIDAKSIRFVPVSFGILF